jgi:predicted GNAT family acetyltransferase
MKITPYTDISAFERDILPFLSPDRQTRWVNSLCVRLIDSIKRGRRQEYILLAVMNDSGKPVLAALQTPPYPVAVSEGDRAAMPMVADYFIGNKLPVHGVNAEQNLAKSFADIWQQKIGQPVALKLELPFYVLENLIPPQKSPVCQLKKADQSDAGWITDWNVAFAIEAGLSAHEQKPNPEKIQKNIELAKYYYVAVHDQPIALGGFTIGSDNDMHIGPVYTLPEHRGHGYASYMIADVVGRFLRSGGAYASLFADINNPVSNKIYQRLGFEYRLTYQSFEF